MRGRRDGGESAVPDREDRAARRSAGSPDPDDGEDGEADEIEGGLPEAEWPAGHR